MTRNVPADPPMFPKYGIIALVPNNWGSQWMGRHQVLSRLARFVNVIWVEPAREWQTVFRDLWRPGTYGRSFEDPSGIVVYRHESWLPKLYRPRPLANWTHDNRLKRARKLLAEKGCQRIILSLWRPNFAPALQSIPHDLSSYHIVDEYSYSEEEQPPNRDEVGLIRSVDQVFVQSQGLMTRLGDINPATLFLPNGVDYESYSKKQDEPFDLQHIPRPIIGYSGYIKKQLDWELIDRLTKRHRDWSFVFVGAPKTDSTIETILDNLAKRSNVHFLGKKSSRELAAYPQHFDVCIMPYRVNAYTNYIYPLKLHEFLASSNPVVGSSIRTLEDFGDIVACPNGFDEWSTAISDALGPDRKTPARVSERLAIARQHDWENVSRKMLQTFALRLLETSGDPLLDLLDDNGILE